MNDDYFPRHVNSGPWVSHYTLNELRRRADAKFVLPICSLGTPYATCAGLGSLGLGELVLPPLYHEALHRDLKRDLVNRIVECFPQYGADNGEKIRVVELPQVPPTSDETSPVLAFSVDTAVEEHGPHLPLATDTIQSYSVLHALEEEFLDFEVERPLEYGQMTWGLPFGFSVDITASLLTQYVRGYINAICEWKKPKAIYVVDVHGSIVHRNAIVDGMRSSRCDLSMFRWLHEPLAAFASGRGDQHAGGVETALVERVDPNLLDANWWPNRIDEMAGDQMSFEEAVALTPDLPRFCQRVGEQQFNGIIGDIRNYASLDADALFSIMMTVARKDVELLRQGKSASSAGESLW